MLKAISPWYANEMYSDYMKPHIHQARIDFLVIQLQQERQYIASLEWENKQDLEIVMSSQTPMSKVNDLTTIMRGRNAKVRRIKIVIDRYTKELELLQKSGQ